MAASAPLTIYSAAALQLGRALAQRPRPAFQSNMEKNAARMRPRRGIDEGSRNVEAFARHKRRLTMRRSGGMRAARNFRSWVQRSLLDMCSGQGLGCRCQRRSRRPPSPWRRRRTRARSSRTRRPEHLMFHNIKTHQRTNDYSRHSPNIKTEGRTNSY